jgi:hypothetical protein
MGASFKADELNDPEQNETQNKAGENVGEHTLKIEQVTKTSTIAC